MGGLCRLVSGIACSLGPVLPGQTVFSPAPVLHLSNPGTPLEHKN